MYCDGFSHWLRSIVRLGSIAGTLLSHAVGQPSPSEAGEERGNGELGRLT
jgi:hypothetical protein